MSQHLSYFRLSLGVALGPIVWFAHFMLVYGVAEFGCRANFNNWVYFDPAQIRVFTLVATVIALVPVIASGVWAWLTFQRDYRTLSDDADTIRQRERFLLVVTSAFGVIFTISLIATALPVFFVAVCDKAL